MITLTNKETAIRNNKNDNFIINDNTIQDKHPLINLSSYRRITGSFCTPRKSKCHNMAAISLLISVSYIWSTFTISLTPNLCNVSSVRYHD